jgi:hypothetical protein
MASLKELPDQSVCYLKRRSEIQVWKDARQ